MKQRLVSLLEQALDELKASGELSDGITVDIIVEHSKESQHGDFASNLALILAKQAKINPRQLATKIVAALAADGVIDKTEIAGPGFINFFVKADVQSQVIKQIDQQGYQFGRSQIGVGNKIQVEFVSANPTGPLHVGHGRGAVYGSAVADLLDAVGFEVVREYYVNDAGRQMDILTVSVWLRYLEQCGEVVTFPSNAYQGDYIRDIAAQVYDKNGSHFYQSIATVIAEITPDQDQGGDKELHIDALIERAKTLLGKTDYQQIVQVGFKVILDDIREDLSAFGVNYQGWFLESQLIQEDLINKALERLDTAGHLYQKAGATWFRSSAYGDAKDRVVIRDNGQSTYFASDIAYHMLKLDQGFDKIINVWGADHHGYIPRVRAALQALGAGADKMSILLVQFAVLYRGTKKVPMSTRSGEFVRLRELREEVGKDAARFFYLMRRSEQHMDFDLQLATSKTNENPVYYVQYAHARVCSVLRQLVDKTMDRDIQLGMANLALLSETHESNLITTLSRYPELVERSALQHEPHQMVHYLRDLANEFHTYYNAHQFLVENVPLRNARINLICAVKQCLANGLGLLGINAVEAM